MSAPKDWVSRPHGVRVRIESQASAPYPVAADETDDGVAVEVDDEGVAVEGLPVVVGGHLSANVGDAEHWMAPRLSYWGTAAISSGSPGFSSDMA